MYKRQVHTFTPVIHPLNPNIVLLTTGTHGIFVSEDDGETWHEWKAIPFMNTHRITFDPSNSDVMYITTFGGGVWRVTMEGTSDRTLPDIGGLIPAPDSILTDPACWDSTNDVGEPIAGGDYLVMLRTEDYRRICRVIK